MPEVWSRDRIIRRALCSLCLVLAHSGRRSVPAIARSGALRLLNAFRALTFLWCDRHRRFRIGDARRGQWGAVRGFGAGRRRLPRRLGGAKRQAASARTRRRSPSSARRRPPVVSGARVGAPARGYSRGLPRARQVIGPSPPRSRVGHPCAGRWLVVPAPSANKDMRLAECQKFGRVIESSRGHSAAYAWC